MMFTKVILTLAYLTSSTPLAQEAKVTELMSKDQTRSLLFGGGQWT